MQPKKKKKKRDKQTRHIMNQGTLYENTLTKQAERKYELNIKITCNPKNFSHKGESPGSTIPFRNSLKQVLDFLWRIDNWILAYI